MKNILLICYLSVLSLSVKAQDTINVSLPLDGKFYINQNNYKNGSNVIDNDADIYKFSNGTLNNRVYINTDAENKTVIFKNITSTNQIYVKGGKAFKFLGNCSWDDRFNIYKGVFEFSGENLTFSSSYGIELGKARSEDCSITFNLDFLGLNNASIALTSNFEYKATITIQKGIVNRGAILANGKIQTGDIVVGTASINSALQGNVINADGNAVYQVKLFHNNDKEFTVQKDNGSGYENYRDYSFSYFHKDADGNNDPCYYIYLPDGDYRVTKGAENYTFTIDGEAVDLTEKDAIASNGIIDLTGGELSWIDGGYKVGDQPYTYDGANGYIFTGTTTRPLLIPADFPADTITLNNLAIDRREAPTDDKAITIEKTDDFEIILNGNTNIVGKKASSSNSATGNIEYTGSGTLTISGVSNNNTDTLYLGRYCSVTGRKLIVKGGTISIEEAFYGENYTLDGTTLFSGDSLVIEGGVTSTYALNEDGSTIINGGKFSRYDAREHTAGGELSATHPVIINGGTVYLEFKNQKDPGITETIKINGGSVLIENNNTQLAAAGDGTQPFAKVGCPTRTDGTQIYQSLYKLPVPTGTRVESITIDGVAYPCNDVFTDTANCIYLWLPETEDVGTDPVTEVTVRADGVDFKFRSYVDIQNEYEAYVDAMNPGQGNKQEIIPLVSLVTTTTNGSFALSGNYTTEYNSNWYACSGSEVNITTTPSAGYELDSIVVNGTKLAEGETAFTVVRPDQPFTQMEISVGFKSLTGIYETAENTVNVYGLQHAIHVQSEKLINVKLINQSGISLYNQQVSSVSIPVPSGIYIVIVDNEAYKVMVK